MLRSRKWSRFSWYDVALENVAAVYFANHTHFITFYRLGIYWFLHPIPRHFFDLLTVSGILSQVVTDLGIHVSSEVDSKYNHEALSTHEIASCRKNFFWSAFTASV